MTHIFGGTWVYLAHESQIPNANDFITGKLGLRPLIITRDSEGTIRALYNRCTHRGTTLCRWEKGNARSFQCPYHGWNFLNTGKLRGVPWADGYAEKLVHNPKYNLAQIPRVESYRGFIFGTLNVGAPSIEKHLGPIKKPIDEWLDRNPGGKVTVCEANRFKYKGNYDNSGDGYHVIYSHQSLLETENRFKDEDTAKGMSYYKRDPDEQPMYIQYMGNGHHFKDKRPNLEKRPGGLWAIESLHPGMEHVAEKLRAKFGERAESLLDLAYQRVSQPLAAWQSYSGFSAHIVQGNGFDLVRHQDRRRGRDDRRGCTQRHQRPAHAYARRLSEFWRSGRHYQLRANSAWPSLRGR